MSDYPKSVIVHVQREPERVEGLEFYNEWDGQTAQRVKARAFFDPRDGQQYVCLGVTSADKIEQQIILPLGVLSDIAAGASLAMLTSAANRLAAAAQRSA